MWDETHQHFIVYVITYQCYDQSCPVFVKGVPPCKNVSLSPFDV